MSRSFFTVSRSRSEAVQFRAILAATYPVFLAAALVQRLRPGVAGPRRSVFGEARAMALSAIPFAFMG
ncbi:hypothetical protein NS228_16895 [Methylobacterium indicum]|uniref:Uncharacterized protein n=1 Tax=Methylobacterium indicum TaxID=1775910 RepID=A0A0J6RQH3_9HYPH|nr:hypothetical protein [Methylobacterium indicum]KMO21425.1 hypothetical protein QR78_08595 [Methylobacterium indicum]KMO25135.1 hypothetical protein QR79_09255 [Methylobacterium indicum]KTS38703.1 hypothetical protein NS228_16895 [Methylobacterium indicum]KTS38934.1 hypothetical protein NS229_01925 [Methylobacterium indicum]KTS54920.1 hypothetical protein NS230_00065 [Methylobacterium indicum]